MKLTKITEKLIKNIKKSIMENEIVIENIKQNLMGNLMNNLMENIMKEVTDMKNMLDKAERIINEKKPIDRNYGICSNITSTDTDRKVIKTILADWDKFSGDKSFPIPHKMLNPYKAYSKAISKNNMWDKRTIYGKNRWEALHYVIEELKKLVSKYTINNVTIDQIERLIYEAEEIKKGNINNKGYGICHNLTYWEQANKNKRNLVKFIQLELLKWNRSSGSLNYPIPHPTVNMYKAYYSTQNMWDKETEYNQNRLEALDYLIENLKQILKENEKE